MTEEIWTIENALNKSLNITKEKTDEIRDTGKQVTIFEADLESLPRTLEESWSLSFYIFLSFFLLSFHVSVSFSFCLFVCLYFFYYTLGSR